MARDAQTDTPTLLERAQHGDMDAAGRLFEAAAERLALYVRLRLGARLRARVDALDVVQETYAQALRSLGGFALQGPGSFERWLCRIAENVVRGMADHHGAKKRTPPGAPQSISAAVNLARRSLAGPATLVDARTERERLRAAMEQLGDAERKMLLLRHFEGRSYDDIAELTQSNRSSVRRRVARAEHQLGALLSEPDGDGDGNR